MFPTNDFQGLVHKLEDRNIWLRDAIAVQDGVIEFSFSIPTSIRPRFAEYVEVQRQATHALAHASLGVPADAASLLSSASLLLLESMPKNEPFPHTGTVIVRQNLSNQPTNVASQDIEVEIDFFTGLGHVAHGRICGKYLPQRVFDRIRGSAPLLTPAPESSGVMTTPSTHMKKQLVASGTNPILSDHENDHVSGMAVICAVEETVAEYFVDQRLTRLSTIFYSFVEKTLPAYIEVEVIATMIRATVRQEERTCAISEANFDVEQRMTLDSQH